MPRKKCELSNLISGKPESFYWLGFLLADGSFDKRGRIKISLAIKDIGHLQKLQTFLNVENISITENRFGNKYCNLQALDSKVSKVLIERYCISTDKTKNPPNLSQCNADELFCISVGFIDGDGHISNLKNRVDFQLQVKCHASWIENLKLMYPNANTRINKSGYALSIISNTEYLKDIKRRAQNLALPLMSRKWDVVDLNFESKYLIADKRKRKLNIFMTMG